MHIEDMIAMRTLAQARRWLNANRLRRFDLTDAERARRVEIYRRQVEEHGHITSFLPPPDERGTKRPRLAGLMHCAQFAMDGIGPADRLIGHDTVERAVGLGELLAEHALIVFDLMADNGTLEAARRVWRHIQANQMTSFTFSEIWHPLRGTFKTSQDMEPAVELLLDHYLILPAENKPLGRPGRRGRRFVVNPKVTEGTGA